MSSTLDTAVNTINSLDAENKVLRAEIERLTRERDEWKEKFIALGQASLLAGTMTITVKTT